MSTQKTISSFFSLPEKQSNKENCKKIPSKKAKLEEDKDLEKTKSQDCPQKEEKKYEITFMSSKVQIGNSWKKVILPETLKPYFLKLNKFLTDEAKTKKIYPLVQNIFSWTLHHQLEDVKVIILGQDPYHGPDQAHGLCFSVQKGISPPPSLKNIYKQLENEIEDFVKPSHGELTEWAKQGVLLLNAVLTVQASNANSHKNKGWEKFTDSIISWISKNLEGVVFMLWGLYAQKKGSNIDKKRHLVLKCAHPSPLSAHNGFFGCEHFSKANQYLEKNGKKKVYWNRL